MTLLRLALTAALVFPTAPVPQQLTVPTIKVDTKLTVVEVTVTDKNGHPVHGLKSEDFVVKEDGKPQPIKNFDEYGTSIPAATPAPLALPPGIYTNQAQPQPTTSATNILLFDQINTGMNLLKQPELFIYSKLQAAKYLKDLPPGTRVAVMTVGEQLSLIQDFTTDKDVLYAAVDRLLYKPALGTLTPDCFNVNTRSRLTLNALKQASAFTSGIPGRKNIVWFTAGIPWLTNYSRFSSIGCVVDYTPQLNQSYSMLSAARDALYTIDSHGLQSVVNAETISGSEPSFFPGMSNFEQRSLNHESLQDFADATGGQAFYNRNDLDAATGEAISSGTDYYAIAYTPPLKGYDGKYHSIDVKLSQAGLKLQYRKGYTSLDPITLDNSIDHSKTGKNAAESDVPPSVSRFRAEMAHGATSSSQLQLVARITPVATPAKPAAPPIKGDLNPKFKANPLIRYDVIYSLPAGQVTLGENPDGTRKVSVEFDIVAYGEDGTKLNVVRQTANLTLKPQSVADFQQKPFEIPLQLDLPPGKLFVRVGALDVLSGKTGTLEIPKTVAKP